MWLWLCECECECECECPCEWGDEEEEEEEESSPCGKKSIIISTPPGLRRSARRLVASAGSSKWWKPRPTTAMSKLWNEGVESSGGGGELGGERGGDVSLVLGLWDCGLLWIVVWCGVRGRGWKGEGGGRKMEGSRR